MAWIETWIGKRKKFRAAMKSNLIDIAYFERYEVEAPKSRYNKKRSKKYHEILNRAIFARKYRKRKWWNEVKKMHRRLEKMLGGNIGVTL